MECATGLLCAVDGAVKFGFAGNTCMPAHCDNNAQDSDETGVDCGGSCGCRGRLELFDAPASIVGISDDGSTLVGYTSGASGHPWYWDSQLFAYELEGDTAYAANADGSVIVGSGNGPARWLDRQPTPEAISSADFQGGLAQAVSSSGTVIAGTGYDGTLFAGFLWDNGVVTWNYELREVTSMSADGAVRYGRAMAEDNGYGGPALWTSSGTTLVELPATYSLTSPGPLSRDGTKLVGEVYSSTYGAARGFIWQNGQVTLFPGESEGSNVYPSAVADNGLIVGQTGRGGMPGNYWTPDDGYAVAHRITDLMAERGLEAPDGVDIWGGEVMTPDGRIIVGGCSTGGYRLTLD